jgi:signal transduction histidine kinase
VPAGLALGVGAEWAALQRGPLEQAVTGEEARLAIADLVVGWTLVGAGLAAWWRVAQSRVGPLLVLTGFTWFLGTFASSSIDAFAVFGAALVTLHRGPLVHALLSFPSGRLGRRFDLAVVACSYLAAAFVDVGQSPVAMVVLGTIVVAAAGSLYLRSTGPLRRARASALAGSFAFGAVLVASAIVDLAGGGSGVGRAVLWSYDAVVVAIALLFAYELLVAPWSKAAVTGLVVELGSVPEEGTLRERLAAALGDPSLSVGYWVAEADAYFDEAGRAVTLPDPESGRGVTVVRQDGEPVAALVHDVGVVDDRELLDSVAAAAQIAVSNVRLQAEIRRQLEELEASRRRIVEAGDRQRLLLERELRDGAERRLAQVKTVLEGMPDGGALTASLATVRAEIELAEAELVEFARGIHPRVLTDGGLSPAVAELARRAAVPVDVRVPDDRFPPTVEAAAYFVCSEALANVGKYAAASKAAVEVTRRGDHVLVAVRDDGAGGASLEKGSGLRGLSDRVEALGGRLHVDSPPGQGTLVVAELPLT